jgi:hypothetical protein
MPERPDDYIQDLEDQVDRWREHAHEWEARAKGNYRKLQAIERVLRP